MNEMAKKLIGILIVVLLIGSLLWFFIFNNKPPKGSEKISPTLTETPLDDKMSNQVNIMKITSSAFKEGAIIPDKYTCDSENILPPLTISNVPSDTKSLALVVDDPDAPAGTWTHLLVWNISPEKTNVLEGDVLDGAVFGTNDFGNTNYGGPCPPSGTHRYYFKVYALDKTLEIPPGSSKNVLEKALNKSIISQSTLMGVYSKK